MTELKDNSVEVKGSILNSVEKTVNKGKVIELKIRIPADELDGKRDDLSKALESTAIIKITPNQTELDTEDSDEKQEADGQTVLNVDGEK